MIFVLSLTLRHPAYQKRLNHENLITPRIVSGLGRVVCVLKSR
jgi:hypothetical protein